MTKETDFIIVFHFSSELYAVMHLDLSLINVNQKPFILIPPEL